MTMRLLAIDTASQLCSAAVLVDGELLVREQATPRDHATLLLPMIDGLLAEAGLRPAGLTAIAFGRGPGSFTGLRVAASVAQGLALGAGVPVVPVSDLRALALQGLAALEEGATAPPPRVLVACCMDARMSEVYAACYEVAPGDLPPDVPERVCAPAEVRPPRAPDVLVGRGFEAYAGALALLRAGAPLVLPSAEPRAREIARLGAVEVAAGRVRDPAEALPVYLRDDVARPAS